MMVALFGREGIIELLLKYGADPGVQDVMGNRTATLAAGQGQPALAKIEFTRIGRHKCPPLDAADRG